MANGNVIRGGPDGVETLIQRDIDDRVSTVHRGPAATPLEAIYDYFDNGLVKDIQYGNGTMTVFAYDAANRGAHKHSGKRRRMITDLPTSAIRTMGRYPAEYHRLPHLLWGLLI